MADEFIATVEAALDDKLICGGTAVAMSKTGKILISEAFGKTSLDDGAEPWAFDSTFWIASSSKLLTAISVLQCVSDGLLQLDDDISNTLTELANPQILTGFDTMGRPQLEPATRKITLRRLLTNSSGFIYYGMNSPLINQYRDSLKLPNDSGTFADYTQPVAFEPGEGWAYGPSLDWAGRAVEKVTGLTLDEYVQKHICRPLGMNQTTFHPLRNKDIMARMVGRVTRDEQGVLIKEETGRFSVREKPDDFGGNGLYSSTQDYVKVLTSLMLNDGKLLSGDMYEALFTGQLEGKALQAEHELMTHPIWGGFLAPGYPRTEETQWNHALGGALVDKEVPGQAGKGTLFWSGLPNNMWFVDRANGVCGFYGSWIIPPGDQATGKLFAALQKAAVKEAQKL